ncbi:MAG: TRAP transporter small permease subunit [Rhodospirillum sp.]|nr:TRAP transporter small permease subunit [Rhodospirillum sp.]
MATATDPPLETLSRVLAKGESLAAGMLCVLLLGLLLLNVITRAAGAPLLWVDELAIFTMVWMALVGASLGLHHRGHIAMTLLSDALKGSAGRLAMAIIDGLTLSFILVLAVLVWRWFDPITAWMAPDLDAFSLMDFNFIYQEPTTTLGVRKIWTWLILPAFCLTSFCHGLRNLTGSLGALRHGGGRP